MQASKPDLSTQTNKYRNKIEFNNKNYQLNTLYIKMKWPTNKKSTLTDFTKYNLTHYIRFQLTSTLVGFHRYNIETLAFSCKLDIWNRLKQICRR